MFLGQKKQPTCSLFCIHFSSTQHLRFPAPKRTGLEEVYCCLAEFWIQLPGTARFSQLQCTLLCDGPIMTYPYIPKPISNYLSSTANLRNKIFISKKKSMHSLVQSVHPIRHLNGNGDGTGKPGVLPIAGNPFLIWR